MSSGGIGAFVFDFQAGNFVKVTVGSTCYVLSKDDFMKTCDYFAKLVSQKGQWRGNEMIELSLRTQYHDAWDHLVYWIMRERFVGIKTDHVTAASSEIVLLVHCWLLGEQYDVPDFQDAAMMYLLSYYEGSRSQLALNPDELKDIYGPVDRKQSRRPLKTLISEEITKQQARVGKQGKDMDDYESIPGLSEFLALSRKDYPKESYKQPPAYFTNRLHTSLHRESLIWKTFMVGERKKLPFTPTNYGTYSIR